MKKRLLDVGCSLLVLVSLALAGPAGAQSSSSGPKLLAEIDGIKAKVETIRGIKFKADFEKGLQSPQAFEAYLKQEIEKEWPEKKLYAWKRWLVKFGFMDETVDVKKLVLDLLQEQVVGYYDPERKRLIIIDRDLQDLAAAAGLSKADEAAMQMMKSLGFDLGNMFMAHELDHALQDQHYDLTRLKKQRESSEDQSTALSALIEGQSTLVMVELMFKAMGVDPWNLPGMEDMMAQMAPATMAGMPKMDQAPAYFRENLMFPYLQGAQFAMALRKAGGWNLLNQAFVQPPESTEQILHPEKYWPKRDAPLLITLPDLSPLLGDEWQRLEENSLGELNISILAKKYLPPETATQLAKGWGGDTFHLYENKKSKQTLLVWYSIWDSRAEAQKFYTGYRQLLDKKSPSNASTILEAKGLDIIVVEGLPAGLKAQVLEKLRQIKKEPLAAPASKLAN